MRDTIRLPDDWDVDIVGSAVGDGFHADRPRTVRVSFLDTFDWRIAATGGRLTEETAGGERMLRWLGGGGDAPHVLPISNRPRFARELPESVIRSRLASLIGIRAIQPVGVCTVQRWSCRMRDGDGHTAVLLELERAAVLDAHGMPTGESASQAEVISIPDFTDRFDEVAAKLRALSPTGEGPDLMEIAVQAQGRSVGDYSSKLALHLDPEQRAADALRLILQTLATTMEANVDGVIADLDTEFLHDLRVATRRTRAALAQLKGVLPADLVRPFREEFKWLGSLTGPCRDLDVHLLEMDGLRSLLGEPPETLDALERQIERARRAALADVRSGLRSARFRRLLAGWRSFLDAPAAEHDSAPDAGRPVRELASRKIIRSYRRMTKRGRGLGDDPPADALHRLRIDAKKLRYLLEFFRSLYDDSEIARLVKDLKKFQDVLGGINDLHVQQQRLREFARDLTADGEVDTVLAMGRLTAALAQREDDLRHAFAHAFRRFAGPGNRARYAALFDTGG